MSRIPAFVVVACLAISLACSGGRVTPDKPRDFVYEMNGDVPDTFQGMDLPFYGGQIERTSETSMTVSYDALETTMEQLKENWPEALAAAGWTEEERGESGNGDMDMTYALPDGRRALVSVITYAPGVWHVYIGLSGGAAP
ncbi:MAG: hypothetical protein ACJATT_005266 [Myxococcota bacterium]|jgi:hypothetical protein